MSGLKLEVGKFYRSRDGQRFGPMKLIGRPAWHKFTDGKLAYGESGGCLSTGQPLDGDLIAEWSEAPTQ